MSEQPVTQTTGQEVSQPAQEKQEQPQEARKVELDEDTYAALLEKLEELEAKVQPPPAKPTYEDEDDVDALAREGKQGGRQAPQDVNFDEMTPAQIIKYVNQNIMRDVASPLMVAVNELKYSMEIDKLTRPKEIGGEGISDLMEYKNEIMSLMIENPKMGMKRAYTIAKAENPEKVKPKEASEKGEREARLRHLPPHPKRAFGERPGQAEASTTAGEPKDLKGAVEKAFTEVFKGRDV